MTSPRTFLYLALAQSLLLSVAACGSSSTKPIASGGNDDGSNAEVGGSSTGSGGATSVGGATASAGATSPGGTTATGGTSTCFDFATSTENWKVTFAETYLLADSKTKDPATTLALKTGTSVEWVDAPGYGSVTNGYVKVTIPYAETQSNYQSVLVTYTPAAPIDFTGKTVTAYIRLDSGMNADNTSIPPGGKIVIKSGPSFLYAESGWTNLSKGQWTAVMLNGNSPAFATGADTALYDSADIRELSLQFDTNASATTVTTPGVVWIDHICY